MKKIDPKYSLKTIFFGFVMGTSEVIPGVSGSAFAIMFGIYDEIINIFYYLSEIAKSFTKLMLRRISRQDFIDSITKINFTFAIPLGIGVILAVIVMSSFVLYLLEMYPQYLYAVLLGLIPSVLVIPIKEMTSKTWKEAIVFVLSFVIAFYILGLSGDVVNNNPSLILLFLGGMLGISGMVLPGVSGGFILVAMGIYYYVIGIIRDVIHMDFTMNQIFEIFVFGMGVGFGFIAISQLLKKALELYKSLLMAFILAVVLASARVLWPFVTSTVVDGDVEVLRVPITDFSSVEIVIIVSIVVILGVVGAFLSNKYSENAFQTDADRLEKVSA